MAMIHAGHQGMERMKQWGREYVWWPGMNRDIENISRTYVRLVDAFSKRVEYEEVKKLTTQIVIKVLKNTWAKFGVAMTVVTDEDPLFISRQFKIFCAETGAKHILAPLYHPSSNGQVERMVAVVKNWLRKLKDGGGEMWVAVSYYNNSRKGEEPLPVKKFLG
ncbi:uncharacterized protein LOC135928681 [Gordionus sp. m RMFG-2023]|uniref:uncharacterized protein LOC135928681 n=1 Tax=Gordionus sp. m RMFG-2023 TaxID=3053472 RepID=UPI0031FC834D